MPLPAIFHRRGAPRLSRLSRPPGLPAAADRRHHHRSDRSAAVRGDQRALRPRDANQSIYAGLYAAEQQRCAYPDIEPLMVLSPPAAAFDAALAHRRPSTMAGGRCARRRRRSRPRRPHRGGGAHARHGLSRRRRDPHARRCRPARGSMCAPPRVTDGTISAPMRAASAACWKRSTRSAGTPRGAKPEPARPPTAPEGSSVSRRSDKCRRSTARRRSRPRRARPDPPDARAPTVRRRRSGRGSMPI